MKQPPSEAVLAAIERLPVLDGERWRIPGAATMLCMAAPVLAMNDVRHLRKGGSAKALRMLEKLERDLVSVAETVRSLPGEAYMAVEAASSTIGARGAEHPMLFQDAVDAMLAAVRIARETNPIDASRPGRPAKRGAAGVAEVALVVFEGLTGQRATITVDAHAIGNPSSGPYLDLVRSLFKAFDIEASAATHAREATRKAKRSPELAD